MLSIIILLIFSFSLYKALEISTTDKLEATLKVIILDVTDDLLEIDRNQLGYMIRSMYFDSINDDDYYEKLSGEVNRKKIRLRIYDKEGELVKLEIKQKYALGG